MKTNSVQFKKLTKKQRRQFKRNVKGESSTHIQYFAHKCKDIGLILKSAFIWGNTPEGHEYWYNIYKQLTGNII